MTSLALELKFIFSKYPESGNWTGAWPLDEETMHSESSSKDKSKIPPRKDPWRKEQGLRTESGEEPRIEDRKAVKEKQEMWEDKERGAMLRKPTKKEASRKSDATEKSRTIKTLHIAIQSWGKKTSEII